MKKEIEKIGNGLLQVAEKTSAFLKLGMWGFAGSGKTYTSVLMAIGLHKYIKSKKPIVFADTEGGSDFVLDMFDNEKIKLLTTKSRSFSDLLAIIKEAEKMSDILIIDSVTHFWNDLLESYLKKKNKSSLNIRDIMLIKREWKPFTELYLNSKLHVFMIGRAGWDFENQEDDDGVKTLTKTHTKMKAEVETGFEPHVILEMKMEVKEQGVVGALYKHRAWCIKDRSRQLQGKFKDEPDFSFILPHVETLNLGGKHLAVDTSRDSQSLFESKDSQIEYFKQKDITIEEIENETLLKFPKQNREQKKMIVEAYQKIFGTASWTAITDKKLDDLKAGLEKLRALPVTLDKEESK